MSYPLSDTARYVWERIDCLVTELLRVPNSRRYVIALFSGDRPEEFPSRLLVELQALSDEHWPLIEPMIPESCTDGLDLRRREVWGNSLGPTDLDPTLVSKLRGMFFRSLDRAASYVLERDRAAAAGGEQGGAGEPSQVTGEKPGRHRNDTKPRLSKASKIDIVKAFLAGRPRWDGTYQELANAILKETRLSVSDSWLCTYRNTLGISYLGSRARVANGKYRGEAVSREPIPGEQLEYHSMPDERD